MTKYCFDSFRVEIYFQFAFPKGFNSQLSGLTKLKNQWNKGILLKTIPKPLLLHFY